MVLTLILCFRVYACVDVTAKINGAATLTCDTKTSEPVKWKFNDEFVENVAFDDRIKLVGKDLDVSDVESPMLGSYSCWRGEDIISSVYLLMEAEENKGLGKI